MQKIEAGKTLTMDQIDMLRRERLALSQLTEQEKVFCETYIRTFDRKLAVKEAKYKLPKGRGGQQTEIFNKLFNEIMASEPVAHYINLLKESVASRIGFSMDDIVEQYKAMAFANMSDYVEWDAKGMTTIKSSNVLSKLQKAGICEITETETKLGKTIKLKLHNKQQALDRLYEVLKELEDRNENQKGPKQVTNQQILLMLGDPVKRRSLEHIAEAMFTKPIKLTGTDKNKQMFNENLTRIVKQLSEATSGISSQGDARSKAIPQITEESRSAEDRPADAEDQRPAEPGTASQQVQEPDGEQMPAAGLIQEDRRYDVDGL